MLVGDFDIGEHIINGNLQSRLWYFLCSLEDTQRDRTLKHSLNHIDNLVNLHVHSLDARNRRSVAIHNLVDGPMCHHEEADVLWVVNLIQEVRVDLCDLFFALILVKTVPYGYQLLLD